MEMQSEGQVDGKIPAPYPITQLPRLSPASGYCQDDAGQTNLAPTGVYNRDTYL